MMEDKRGKRYRGEDMLQCRVKEGTRIKLWRIREGKDIEGRICFSVE